MTTAEYYATVFNILIEHAGAPKSQKETFIDLHGEFPVSEFRFQGSLGFGGKYYRDKNRISCYREDETPERIEIIKLVNDKLKQLKT